MGCAMVPGQFLLLEPFYWESRKDFSLYSVGKGLFIDGKFVSQSPDGFQIFWGPGVIL